MKLEGGFQVIIGVTIRRKYNNENECEVKHDIDVHPMH